MPRTKTQKPATKRNRNSDEDGLKMQLKEMKRIHDDFESERIIVWQRRKELITDITQKFRFSLSAAELEMTVGEFVSCKSSQNGSLLTEASQASRADDDESSRRSSKPKKTIGTEQKKKHRRSRSAAANVSTMSARPLSRVNSVNERLSRSKYRTPVSRLQTMSADRSVMAPVTPKIQMNTPMSLLRYPKVGETIISMSGSPVIVNGGTMQGIANINIPIKDGMFSMQPNAITDVDSDLVSRIDNTTMNQLRQLQANLNFVMSTFSGIKKKK
ncbi:borealin-like isoform X2 [Bradysia coprophila]|uniref:borealin-like isoform X2 n=1 Tax=Bradysia coprophila TaxID=38358 RepID=UPI00187D8902|nr:borealin-like isoform X2 [Bradysia coprophila]